MSIHKISFIIGLVCVFFCNFTYGKAVLLNHTAPQLGDSIACFSLAKILSVKHAIPLYYESFIHSDLFMIDMLEHKMTPEISARPRVYIRTEEELIKNKHRDVILYTDIRTRINYIDQSMINAVKKDLQLKKIPSVKKLPKNTVTVGVHIRKGNGGGAHYDGEQSSLQEFNFDRSQVIYRTDYESFILEWNYYQRYNGYFFDDHERAFLECLSLQRAKPGIDHVAMWETRFPPNQYYIDQIRKLSSDLRNIPLYVRICTDDKNPEQLVRTIKKAVNKRNIVFDYENDRHLPFKDRIHRDLYILSHCDVLIRGQSYFSRIAEIIGNHTMVIYPFWHQWDDNKLIMTQIIVKGSLAALRKK